jgi:hypothetical protein
MLCIYLSGSVGIFLGFRVAQHYHYLQVSKLISHNLQKSNITLLKISTRNQEALHWKNNKKEFEYKGQNYDLIKASVTREAICIYCYLDVKEKQLRSFYEQKKNSSRKADKSLPKIQISICILPQSITEILLVFEHNSYLFHNDLLISLFADIHSPPPKYLA